MAFLDEIDKKLTEIGRGAMQKTKEASDTVKISNTIRNLESQKRGLYVELGESFYRMHREIADEKEKQIIQQIESLETEIKNNQEQMTRIKGVICCPNCNAEIPAASAFCNVCGTRIERKAGSGAVSNNLKVCRQCGAALEANQMFCTNCGAKAPASVMNEDVEENCTKSENAEAYEEMIVSHNTETDVYDAETDDAEMDVFYDVEADDAEMDADDVGVEEMISLDEIISLAETKDVVDETGEQEICSKCGAQVEPGQSFCTQCGNKL